MSKTKLGEWWTATAAFAAETLAPHWFRIAYLAFVGLFCAVLFGWWPPSRIEIVFVGGALAFLPFAVLSSRLKDNRSVAEGGFDVFVEVLVAIASGFLLLGLVELEHPSQQPFINTVRDKIPEISVVFILLFAIQIVSKSAALFDPAVKQMSDAAKKIQTGSDGVHATVAALASVREKLDSVASEIRDSGEQIQQARYASLAARVLGIKNREHLMIPGVDGRLKVDAALAPITERALDSLQAWIQTGFSIDSKGAGPLGRQTWWRLMEAYHREEVFDVTQLEVATNVRNFAMMLLLAIGYHIAELKPDERLVLLNVSKFPPKDFYNFPDGNAEKRFYHEPEFFGTYRRALGAIARHPQICPLRIFLCGPGNDVFPPSMMAALLGRNGGRAVTAGPGNAVGMDTAKKIAYDCAFLSFLPIPLTFPYTKDAPVVDDQAPQNIQDLLHRCTDVFKGLPRGVDRALINPHYRWVPPEGNDGGRDWLYHEKAIGKLGNSDRTVFRANTASSSAEAQSILQAGISGDDHTRGTHSEPANFKGQLDAAWHDLVERCLGFGWGNELRNVPDESLFDTVCKAREALISLLDLDKRNILPDSLAAKLNEAIVPHEEQYLQYVDSVKVIHDDFEECKALVAGVYGADANAFDEIQKKLVKLELGLLTRCQTIDSLDKYFELISPQEAGPAAITASTGLKLGFGENWLHRALMYLEGTSILEDVRKHGPVPLWKLLASDLCGLWDPSDDLDEQFKTFLGHVTNRIRVYDPTEDKESVLDEFMLLGVAHCVDAPGPDGTVTTFHADVQTVQWKALIGTHINEPFHTCRIQFDFGNYLFGTGAAGGQADPARADRRQGKALSDHVDWAARVWKDSGATTAFEKALKEKWEERLRVETTA